MATNGSNDTTDNASTEVPDLLYHTTLTVIDYHTDTSGSTRTVYPLGTHTTVKAAKAFAAGALESLNYSADDFTSYAVRPQGKRNDDDDGDDWPYGDGVIAYTKAPAGQEFLISLDTKPNTENLLSSPDNTPELPSGADHLHYVLQTRIDYNQDKSGAFQSTEIEGVYIDRMDAVRAAKEALGEEKTEFAQYDERDSEEMSGEWPFGEDVLVHAVAQTGENYTIAVRTVPGARERCAKKM